MGDDTPETRGWPPDPTPGSSSSHPAPSRQRIGQYEIRSVIASGGMGVVYEAFQQSPRRPVALKIMRLGLASASARERFEREAQLLARLHHSGIVQVFEAGTHNEGQDQVPFIAMEFIPGARTITEYATVKALDADHIVELLMQACAAIHHGNEKGIIHRDIKPSNLLVDQDGNVKVIDFGVARALDNDNAAITLHTQIGQIVGTVQYMSPEQIGGDPRAIDARADVYSLGVVLYELLAGRLPFDLAGKSLAEASRIIQSDTPTRLSSAAPLIDPALETVVSKACARDRGERYSSVHAFAEDLGRWSRGEETIARAASPVVVAWRSTRRLCNRNRVLAGMFIAVVATLSGWLLAQLLVNHIPAFSPVAVRLQRAASSELIENFQNVKAIIINRTDGTLTAEADAAVAGMSGVSNSDFRSWRLIHASLMKRIAISGAQALVFDIHFPGSYPLSDDAMLEGIAACDKAQLPLILFRRAWPGSEAAGGPANDRILADPRVVTGVGSVPNSQKVEVFTFANQRGNKDAWPSLVLAAWARMKLGHYPIEYSYNFEKLEVTATSREPAPSGLGPVRDRIAHPVSSIQAATVEHRKTNVQIGDMLALKTFGFPTPEALADASITMSEVLAMSDTQLRDTFGGLAVLVGDAANDERVTFANKEIHPGYVVHMAALEGLAAGSIPKVVDDRRDGVLLVLSAAVWGIFVAMGMRKFFAGLALWISLSLSICVSAIVVYSLCYYSPNLFGLIIHPLALVIGTIVASSLSCLIFKPGGHA